MTDHDHSEEFNTTAQALAQPYSDEDPLLSQTHPHSQRRSLETPAWTRRRATSSTSQSQRPRTKTERLIRRANKLGQQTVKTFFRLSLLQRILLVVAGLTLLILGILFLIFNERIFARLSPAAKKWRELPGGWLILFFMTFFVSFPPCIGYSSCVTIAGFVYGMWGWVVIAIATTLGSTASFLASRSLLKKWVDKWTAHDKRFAALSLVLKHDGLKLLVMIRLCPLPYSFSNGAVSTIPTVTWYNFLIATAIASPKHMLGVFVGAQVAKIADTDEKMSLTAKAASYIGIFIGVAAGIATGYFMYIKTKARAEELEAEEVAAAQGGRRSSVVGPGEGYADDPEEAEAVNILRGDDDISLHPAYADDDYDSEGAGAGYRDEFSGDEDAEDVFAEGEGPLSGDEEEGGRKAEK
ncbi:hypothetical protein K431DRAFT_288573 [Polychaeton citri CBS 116435]|uniref:Golgi apparatus membrane protein TVP38 n=1 Tax=Polychaeton citri CBS 116435 TaxID=1314669 RepID=A0A9P4Q3M7_9PEZI|nr:hypothetical protein K431DRAFT_288573 [Polychaeton citri CBS 116435]